SSFASAGVSVDTSSNNVTIQNVTTTGTAVGVQVFNSANRTIQNNTLTGSGTGLYLDTVTGLTAGAISGNTFSNSATGLRVWNISGITIGDASVAGANIVLTAASGQGTTATGLDLP